MSDIFEDIFANQPLDPMQAAQRAMRPGLRKRFYDKAAVAEKSGGFAVTLDGKQVRSPARRTLAAPARPLADALVAEWDAQRELIDPAAMPLTRLANSIIDGVVDQPQPVADEIVKYISSDLLLYRAEQPQRLVEKQAQAWDPILAWAADNLGARFFLVQGVMHATQPDLAVAAARAALPADAWRLGAVHAATTLTGSGLLALALAHGAVTSEDAWRAAHVDEDWQIEKWGEDKLARERRDFRFAEFEAAAAVLWYLTD